MSVTKMKQKSVELVFIIDKSGSMSGLENDTIDGFNSMIEKRKSEGGDIRVTSVLFDTVFTTIHDRVPIGSVDKMTGDDYMPSGCTALLDAVGSTITNLKNLRSSMKKKDIPKSTLFVIITDGYENSSREYTYNSVKNLIGAQKEDGWEFIFLGANIDAAKEASKFGVSKECAVNYKYDEIGVRQCYDVADRALSCVMGNVCLKNCTSWREDADDYHSDKKKREEEKERFRSRFNGYVVTWPRNHHDAIDGEVTLLTES